MAHLHPGNIAQLRLSGARGSELDTFERLGRELPDDYTVYHSVRWLRPQRRGQSFGEIDFLVVNAAGDIVLIEQKDGPLRETPDGLAKDYHNRDRPKSVVEQIHRARDGLLTALGSGLDGAQVHVNSLLYCPDHRLADTGTAGLPPEAIVDASSRDALAERIVTLLGDARPDRGAVARSVRALLAQELELAVDLGHTAEQHEATYQRLSGGLAEMVQRLEMQPWHLRIRAAAGSGKSQAAVEFFEREEAAGRRVALICFNRPLAERLRQRLPGRDSVDTFHALCRRWLEQAGEAFDTDRLNQGSAAASAYWTAIIERLIELEDRLPPFDTVIIDEGQDFEPEWWELLRLFVTDEGRLLWLEDPEQNLYGREAITLDGFVTYNAPVSYRTPRRLGRLIDKLLAPGVAWHNPLDGLPPRVHTYADEQEQMALLEERVAALEEQGFAPDQIVLLSLHGVGKSHLLQQSRLGAYTLRTPQGYGEQGEPLYTAGRLLAESVYRFKGEHAPAVLLTDLDHQRDNDQERRLLDCALTRATVACEVLVAEASPWAKRLQRAV